MANDQVIVINLKLVLITINSRTSLEHQLVKHMVNHCKMYR
jgi:hypothetical protein